MELQQGMCGQCKYKDRLQLINISNSMVQVQQWYYSINYSNKKHRLDMTSEQNLTKGRTLQYNKLNPELDMLIEETLEEDIVMV